MIEDIKAAKNIGIIINDYDSEDQFFSALALFLLFKKAAKNVYFKLNENVKLSPLGRNFQVVLKTKKEISDIYYEKKGGELNIFLTPDEDITEKDFVCSLVERKNGFGCDLIVAIGFDNIKAIEKNEFKDFDKAKVINIDNKISNTRFGSINLIGNNIPIRTIVRKNFEKYLIDETLLFLLSCDKNLLKIFKGFNEEEGFYVCEVESLKAEDLPRIISILKDYLQMENFMLLWNKQNGIVYTNKKAYLESLEKTFNARIKNNGALIEKNNLTKQDIFKTLKQYG